MYVVGRGFARVLAELRGKETGELVVGLGRDMRLSAPEMAAGVRQGLVDEGARVLDAGQIATEMLYFLVGSRELDGGAMVTAPTTRRRTGVKLVREGRSPFPATPGSRTSARRSRPGCPSPRAGSVEELEIGDDFRNHILGFIDPEAIGPLKILADGGNGMAGPMVGPLLDQLNLEVTTTYWTPDGSFPDREPNPLSRRTAATSSAGSARRASIWRSPGMGMRTVASSSTRRAASATETSSALCSPGPP